MQSRAYTFRCVLAADILPRLREAYVKNFPELRSDYRRLFPPHRCEQAGLADLYDQRGDLVRIHGDLATLVDVEANRLRRWPDSGDPIVPEHDLLCAGFPCQPFSKSGAQLGFDDLNGTVFRMLAVILRERRPRFVLLENVGNFERHDKGNTWRRVRDVLDGLGYSVKATTTVGGEDGGFGLLSPHHIGLPQHRERFFIVAQHREQEGPFPELQYPFPLSHRSRRDPEKALARLEKMSREKLVAIIKRSSRAAPPDELAEARVSPERERCVNHWRDLLLAIGSHNAQCDEGERIWPLPSFPIWGFELDPWNDYPIQGNPRNLAADLDACKTYRRALLKRLGKTIGADLCPGKSRDFLTRVREQDIREWVASWPGYARDRSTWPTWKRRFIEQNRAWAKLLWDRLDRRWLRSWLDTLFEEFPSTSHHKLEWNCQGEDLDLWNHILQFRPSGIRVKRFRHIPALVAMTTTQIPIVPSNDGLPARGRHLLISEALALQGFPRTWKTPLSKAPTFEALGNAVHVDLVSAIVRTWLFADNGPHDAWGGRLEQPFQPPLQFGGERPVITTSPLLRAAEAVQLSSLGGG